MTAGPRYSKVMSLYKKEIQQSAKNKKPPSAWSVHDHNNRDFYWLEFPSMIVWRLTDSPGRAGWVRSNCRRGWWGSSIEPIHTTSAGSSGSQSEPRTKQKTMDTPERPETWHTISLLGGNSGKSHPEGLSALSEWWSSCKCHYDDVTNRPQKPWFKLPPAHTCTHTHWGKATCKYVTNQHSLWATNSVNAVRLYINTHGALLNCCIIKHTYIFIFALLANIKGTLVNNQSFEKLYLIIENRITSEMMVHTSLLANITVMKTARW